MHKRNKKYKEDREDYEVEIMYKPGALKQKYKTPSMGTVLKTTEKELNHFKKKHKY